MNIANSFGQVTRCAVAINGLRPNVECYSWCGAIDVSNNSGPDCGRGSRETIVALNSVRRIPSAILAFVLPRNGCIVIQHGMGHVQRVVAMVQWSPNARSDPRPSAARSRRTVRWRKDLFRSHQRRLYLLDRIGFGIVGAAHDVAHTEELVRHAWEVRCSTAAQALHRGRKRLAIGADRHRH